MKHLYKVLVYYVNGSSNEFMFDQFTAVLDFCRTGISYSGGRVRRVEVHMHDGGRRPMWDIAWDDVSKEAALWNNVA